MQKLTTRLIITAIALFYHYPAAAQDCATVKDASERLACYDRQFSGDNASSVTEPVTTETENGGASDADETFADPVESAETVDADADRGMATQQPDYAEETIEPYREDEVIPVQEPARSDEPSQKPNSKSSRKEYRARIVDLVNEYKKKMVFQLDNDEIWIQTSPRNLTIKSGERVTMKKGLMGGWVLRTDRGVSTRVSLLPAPD